MKRINEACVQDILNRADVVDIVGEYVRLENKGGRFWGLCPFHNERTPSFSVNREKNFYFCFGCKKGGSPVNFLMETEKLSYPEALEAIAKKYGIEIVYDQSHEEAVQEDRKSELYELNSRIGKAFNYVLNQSKEGERALGYLKKRALSPETIEKFMIGWAPDDPFWLHRFLTKKGYSADFLAQSGLFSKKSPEYSFFRGRVMFPILDPRGNVIAFGGRILEGDGPKYLNSSESDYFQKGRNLFGYFQAVETLKKEKQAILCEGYMDVISLHQAGICQAVAPLGTAFTDQQANLLKRSCTGVRLSFDSDDAGQKATDRAAMICEKTGLDCVVVQKGDLKDPSEVLEKEGPGILKKVMETTINVMDYLIQKAILLDTGTISGKNDAIRSLFPFLEAVGSEVRRELCISQIAQRFGVEKQSIERDFLKRGEKKPVERLKPETGVEALKSSHDLTFMLAVAANRNRFAEVRAEISVDDLEDTEAKSLYFALEESFRNDEDTMDAFLAHIADSRIRDLVLERMAAGEFQLNEGKFIADAVISIKIRGLERKSADIKRSIVRISSDSSETDSGINDLMYEKMYLDTELARLKGERE
jgi:DNA primase